MNKDEMNLMQAYMQQFTPRPRTPRPRMNDGPEFPPPPENRVRHGRSGGTPWWEQLGPTSPPPRPGPGDRDPRPRQRPLPGSGDRDPRPRQRGGGQYVPQSSPGEILGDYGQFIADYPGRVIGQTNDMFKDSANAWLRQIPGINFGPFG